jgi:hypothetical protein
MTTSEQIKPFRIDISQRDLDYTTDPDLVVEDLREFFAGLD